MYTTPLSISGGGPSSSVAARSAVMLRSSSPVDNTRLTIRSRSPSPTVVLRQRGSTRTLCLVADLGGRHRSDDARRSGDQHEDSKNSRGGLARQYHLRRTEI